MPTQEELIEALGVAVDEIARQLDLLDTDCEAYDKLLPILAHIATVYHRAKGDI